MGNIDKLKTTKRNLPLQNFVEGILSRDFDHNVSLAGNIDYWSGISLFLRAIYKYCMGSKVPIHSRENMC